MISYQNPTQRTWLLRDAPEIERTYGPYFELMHGALVVRERPGFRHGSIAATLIMLLGPYVRTHRLGRLSVEGGFILTRSPDTLVSPDVSFVCRDRLETTLSSPYFEGPPDLAIEIRSPNDRWPDIVRKGNLYMTSGTRLLWHIDPADRTITIWHRDGTRQVVSEVDELDGADVILGWRCGVREIFR